jgi:betaine-aldehyde dehydrogenase
MHRNRSLFYDNRWHRSQSENQFVFKNLDNKKILIQNSNLDDIKKVINSSKNSFNFWKKKSLIEKSKYLYNISKIILKYKNILAKKESFDTGKSFSQSESEVNHCAELWKHASKEILKFNSKKIKINNTTFCRIYNEPVGVTAVIIPWNFPLIVLSERLPYILATGCVGILKPSELASSSIIKFIEIIKEANLPKGVINLLTGDHSTGSLLIKQKDVRMISFTGATETGKKVMKVASADLKRVSLELGGKNPFIVFNDANIDKAVKNCIVSFTHNSGQCCVGVSRVFIEEKYYKNFSEKLKMNLLKENKLFRISNERQYNKVFSYLKKRNFNKEKILVGKIPSYKNKKFIVKPLVLTNLSNNDDIHKSEMFSPIITLESFKNKSDLLDILNKSKYGLSCIVWSKNISKSLNFINEIQIGRIWINGNINQNYPEIPIGGFKWSGIGRETGKSGFEMYSEKKSVIVNL